MHPDSLEAWLCVCVCVCVYVCVCVCVCVWGGCICLLCSLLAMQRCRDCWSAYHVLTLYATHTHTHTHSAQALHFKDSRV